MKKHIGIVSVNFDVSPEGVCTGRLVRALLEHGFRITLLTSTKADTGFEHPDLCTVAAQHRPRDPRLLFRWAARLQGQMAHNFYLWDQRISRRRFTAENIPDVFYGRAWPFSSLIPAYRLAAHYHRPFIAHLSDPVPPPNEPPASVETAGHLQKMLDAAAAITFTNAETIDYQANFSRFDRRKAFVLPHVSPGEHKLSTTPAGQDYFYIGAIGNREPVLGRVMQAMQRHRQHFPQAALHFVNRQTALIRRYSEAAGLDAAAIPIHPFAPDIKTVLEPATALISLEPQVEKPIWTLTKTIEYLSTNRPILALTSASSPTTRILQQFPQSCVVVNGYTAAAIAEGFDKLAGLQPDAEHYAQRLAAMRDFKAANVAQKFAEICDFACQRFSN